MCGEDEKKSIKKGVSLTFSTHQHVLLNSLTQTLTYMKVCVNYDMVR